MRDISLLSPWLREKAIELVSLCKQHGITIIITQTFRTKQEQDSLYAQGRTTKGNIVTNVKYPMSMHCFGEAFDVCPIVNGKADYSNRSLFLTIGKLGESLGLEWGGNWKSFVDSPHFQTPNISCSDLIKRYKTPETYVKSWKIPSVVIGDEEEVDKIKTVVNGKEYDAFLKDDTAYIPAKILRELGLKVGWDAVNKKVTISK